MRYYRVHTAENAYLTRQPRGIFTAVWRLVDDGILSEAETAEYWRNRRYFEEILPVPPFYEQGNPEGAITWFKDTEAGNRIYEQLTFYRDMAAKYGLALFLTECNELPGEVIYEDDYQIAVKNQRNDLPLQTRKIQA